MNIQEVRGQESEVSEQRSAPGARTGRVANPSHVPLVVLLMQVPDTERTEPYTVEELMARWGCGCRKTVLRAVAGRSFKVGHEVRVRPCQVMEIEKRREGRR